MQGVLMVTSSFHQAGWTTTGGVGHCGLMISFGTGFFNKGTEFYFTYDRVLHWQKYALEKSKKEEKEDTFKSCKRISRLSSSSAILKR
jgi:hypothetical protein